MTVTDATRTIDGIALTPKAVQLAGWLSFQPMWDEIIRTDPDLFD